MLYSIVLFGFSSVPPPPFFFYIEKNSFMLVDLAGKFILPGQISFFKSIFDFSITYQILKSLEDKQFCHVLYYYSRLEVPPRLKRYIITKRVGSNNTTRPIGNLAVGTASWLKQRRNSVVSHSN